MLKEKIAASQFRKLVIMFCLGNSILITPVFLAQKSEQDAWISSIVGFGGGMILVWLYLLIANLFRNASFIEFCYFTVGKAIGKVVSLLYFAYSLVASIILVRTLGNFMVITALPETPILAIHVLFLGVVIFGVCYGLENIARTCEIFMPWLYAFILFFVFFIMKEIKFEKIQPILEQGVISVFDGSLTLIGTAFLELVLLLIIYPHVIKEPRKKNPFLLGFTIGGFLLILSTFLTISTIGAEATSSVHYPGFILAQQISIFNFIQRPEAFISSIWIITIFFKLSICFYVSITLFAQTFGIKNTRLLSVALGIIVITLSMEFFPNVVFFTEFIKTSWLIISIFFGFIFPLFLFLIAKFQLLSQ
ncbi:endospore germination permease [Alkalihalobacillus sp. BA299]|uniref:GerAB/ArcD/ProY family transporter n=1 Tax=Alkalihalobacillus sp. BA299 TaxID=2815938 RepID=UPI001ADC77CA|nr:endospore germination permease [Alkalihalobacillus sp. BA299]